MARWDPIDRLTRLGAHPVGARWRRLAVFEPRSAEESSDPVAPIRAGIRAHVHYVANNPEFSD